MLLIYLLILVASLIGLMAVFPQATAKLAINAERSRSGLTYKTVVIDDETWHYLEGGPADAEVLLLLHGFGGDKDNWTRFSKYLTGSYRVIAPDLPGFGYSTKHADWDYSMPPQRSRVNGFAKALGLEQFHIAGNSMGGYLATVYSHKYPVQVRSLALFNNAGINAPNESDMQRLVAKGENPLIADSLAGYDELLEFVAYKKIFLPWPVRGVFARGTMRQAELNRTIFDSIQDDLSSGLESVLVDIEKPVLILWGEYDRVLDVSSVDVMKPLLPQAEVIVMKDTGHLPMIERPADTAEHYLKFMENN
ncbi:MAG: alpha/beta hydrolase [Gammaproteobacteria bacterium]|nr:MAG: alpha/beta hydrolase [Gammaproteobacteria bacterium]RLA37745.1 MAG: alpha/beta hydrolase [Gammaproteobacteria bacterium]